MKIITDIFKKAERKAVAHKFQIFWCFSLFLKFCQDKNLFYEELVSF